MFERFSSWSRGCLTMQGYSELDDVERKELWLGLRFAPLLCLTGIALGTILASPVLLLAMAVAAFVGGFLTPKHPFDYAYDVLLRPLLGGPAVPASPARAASPARWRRPGSSRSPLPSGPTHRWSPGLWPCHSCSRLRL